MRWAITSLRPTSTGRARFSSTTICAARSTRSFSPSAKATRLFLARLATLKMGFMVLPEAYTKLCSFSL